MIQYPKDERKSLKTKFRFMSQNLFFSCSSPINELSTPLESSAAIAYKTGLKVVHTDSTLSSYEHFTVNNQIMSDIIIYQPKG